MGIGVSGSSSMSALLPSLVSLLPSSDWLYSLSESLGELESRLTIGTTTVGNTEGFEGLTPLRRLRGVVWFDAYEATVFLVWGAGFLAVCTGVLTPSASPSRTCRWGTTDELGVDSVPYIASDRDPLVPL